MPKIVRARYTKGGSPVLSIAIYASFLDGTLTLVIEESKAALTLVTPARRRPIHLSCQTRYTKIGTTC